jgi:RNA polymerase sigma-70 factor (ECF subfamily)
MRRQLLAVDVTVQPRHQRDQDERFEREALPWLDDVYRFALSLTRDEADAEDIVQDTFLRAYKSWHTYAPDSDCRRWLFTICRNAFLRAREKERATVELFDSEVDLMAASTLFFEAMRSGHEDLHARVDLGPALAHALSQLPEPFRSTVLIVDVEDQPYEAAAEIMGVPIGTVRSRLFRGRRILQEQLLAFARDAGLATHGAPVKGEPHD